MIVVDFFKPLGELSFTQTVTYLVSTAEWWSGFFTGFLIYLIWINTIKYCVEDQPQWKKVLAVLLGVTALTVSIYGMAMLHYFAAVEDKSWYGK